MAPAGPVLHILVLFCTKIFCIDIVSYMATLGAFKIQIGRLSVIRSSDIHLITDNRPYSQIFDIRLGVYLNVSMYHIIDWKNI